MSAHPINQPLRTPAQRAELRTIRAGIDAHHPLSEILEAIEAATVDPLRWDASTLDQIADAMTWASGVVDEWRDNAAERRFGAQVDAAMWSAGL